MPEEGGGGTWPRLSGSILVPPGGNVIPRVAGGVFGLFPFQPAFALGFVPVAGQLALHFLELSACMAIVGFPTISLQPGQMALDAVHELLADRFVAGHADANGHLAHVFAGLLDINRDIIALGGASADLAVNLGSRGIDIQQAQVGSGLLSRGGHLVGAAVDHGGIRSEGILRSRRLR